MDLSPETMGARALAGAIRSGALSARDATEAVLVRAEALNPQLNAFRVLTAARARAEADAVDAALAAGRDPGPLAGVPYGVKDLFDVAGLTTVAGSKINQDLPPAAADAALVARMAKAGATLLGVQVMDEYAYGFTTENTHFGPARNPHDSTRSAGGSSGGSAAAVAAGLGAFALGSDTNGSIRVPASFCGLFGLKPTFGRLPRSGSFPFVFDLDHLGALTRSAEDLAFVYDTLQGWDGGDPGCVRRPLEPTLPSLQDTALLRVGVLGGWFADYAGPEAHEAVRAAADALGAREHVHLEGAELARSAAYLITAASGANLHRDNLRARPGDFDPGTRGRLLAGSFIPADALLQAQRARRRVYDQAMDLFARFDILLAPATPCPAITLGQATMELNGRAIPARANVGVLTQPISCLGLPVVAAPIAREGLPTGVQLIAAPWREDQALRCAARLERAGVARSGVVTPC